MPTEQEKNEYEKSQPFDRNYPPCLYCKHIEHIGRMLSLTGWTCKAFKTEIPFDILSRATEHNAESFFHSADDNNIFFESKEYKARGINGKEIIRKITFGGQWYEISEKEGV